LTASRSATSSSSRCCGRRRRGRSRSSASAGGNARRRRMTFLWRLPFPLLLALRYLRSTRKDAFVSFLSAVAARAIGLGLAALVLALAALAGLQQALRGEVLARTPPLEIELPDGSGGAALRARLR